MNGHWLALAERSGGAYTSEEIEVALYRLVTEQVLYHSDRRSRRDYDIIATYERDLRGVVAALGVELHVDRTLRYAYALPRHAKTGAISTGQTIFALVLRQIYDEALRQGKDVSDSGEVMCDLVELEEKYRLLTKRPFPASKSELRDYVRTARRWGIARVSDGTENDLPESALQGQDFVILIRPAITVVLGEAALSRIAGWTATGAEDATEDHSAIEEDSMENEEQ